MLSNEADELQKAIDSWAFKIKDEVNKQLPCIITKVNGNGATVDCLVIRNDEEQDVVFPNVLVKHIETQRAYIFLGLKKGDKGVINPLQIA